MRGVILASAIIAALALVVASMALWPFENNSATGDGETAASAAVQFALDKACGGNKERYYDTVTSYSPVGEDGSPAGTIVYEQSHDGNDSYGRGFWPVDGQSDPLVQTFIAKGDKTYEAWDNAPSEWKVSDRSADSMAFQICQPSAGGSADETPSANEVVGAIVENIRPADYQYEGEVTLDGVRLKHYIRSTGAAGASDPTPTPTAATFREAFGGADLRQIFDEVWIDASGRLSRVNSRIILPFNQIIRLSIKFSGYGEPNVITAPTLPTPTPTPTPVDAPTPTPTSTPTATPTATPTSTATSTPTPAPPPGPVSGQ